MWTCPHADMATCGHADMRTCGHVDMSTCRHVHMRTWRHSDMRTCAHVDMRTCGDVDMRTCAHADMCTCRHVDMSTCRHVHMRTWRHVDMRTCRARVDPGSTPGRPRSTPGRPRATRVGPDLVFFRGGDFKIDFETIINGRSMPWSFGCTKRRLERMKLKPFYGFARLTRRPRGSESGDSTTFSEPPERRGVKMRASSKRDASF